MPTMATGGGISHPSTKASILSLRCCSSTISLSLTSLLFRSLSSSALPIFPAPPRPYPPPPKPADTGVGALTLLNPPLSPAPIGVSIEGLFGA